MTDHRTDGESATASVDVINQALRCLVEAANPSKVILFGSYARGDATRHSDLDFLVILPEVSNRYAEMVRLRDALAALPIPIDVIVCSTDEVQQRGHLRGTMLYHALKEGKILHAAA